MATSSVFLPGKLHGQKSLRGQSTWSHKRVGHHRVTEHACTHAWLPSVHQELQIPLGKLYLGSITFVDLVFSLPCYPGKICLLPLTQIYPTLLFTGSCYHGCDLGWLQSAAALSKVLVTSQKFWSQPQFSKKLHLKANYL